MSKTIYFHSRGLFAGDTGSIDTSECVIRGVSLITGNCEAEGHELQVDGKTVEQLFTLAKERGKVPVNLDHGSGIEKMNGFITNFRMDGDKLRGDWHLLKNHDETQLMLERAAEMPDCFGLSVAFKGKGVDQPGGKKAARAEKLLSVDCVTRPAANKDGLFAARDEILVDNEFQDMADNNNTQGEPSISDVLAAIQQLNSRLDSHEQVISEMQNSGEDDAPLSPEELAQLDQASDEQLAEIGLTREDVNAAVDAFVSQTQGEGDEGSEGEGEGAGYEGGSYEGASAGGGEMAGAGASDGGGAGSAAFNALAKEVIQLRSLINKDRAAKVKEGEDMQFSEVAGKIQALQAQRAQSIELAEALVNENEALRIALETGTRPVVPGVENGKLLFSANGRGELHGFQQLVKEIRDAKKCSEGQAIFFAMKEPGGQALHVDWLRSQSGTINMARR